MKQEKNKEEKRKTGMARCLELASEHKGLVIISGILSALAAVCSFIPYLSIYFVIRELILVFPDMPATDMPAILMCGWFALAGIAGNVVLYFCALMCSHLAAFLPGPGAPVGQSFHAFPAYRDGPCHRRGSPRTMVPQSGIHRRT